MNKENAQEELTVIHVANELRTSPQNIRRLLRKRRMKGFKKGLKNWTIYKKHFDEYKKEITKEVNNE